MHCSDHGGLLCEASCRYSMTSMLQALATVISRRKENILVTAGEQPYVIDFGTAVMRDGSLWDRAVFPPRAGVSTTTPGSRPNTTGISPANLG